MQAQGEFLIMWQALFAGFAMSLAISLLIVATKRWHGAFTMDNIQGVQKFHTLPTPRIGGVALLCGGLAAWLALPPTAPTADLFGLFIAGAIPAFAAGIVEDITKKVSVKIRLLATAASGLLAAVLTGYWISYVNLPGIDWLLAVAPLGILFTAFAVAGIANSVNIIDGFNGLASGVVVLMLLTLGFIAYRADDMVLVNMAFVGVAVVLGFMLVNYPKGHLFLGDAGAYTLGYFVAVLAVALVVRNPGEVSPWAMLLVCGYPVIETLFSVYRRATRKRRHNPATPDASHLHSLVYRRVVNSKLMPNAPAWQRNAATSPLIWMYAVVPMVGALFWPESLGMVLAWLVFSVVAYVRLYRRILGLGIFFRRRVS